MEGRNQSGGGGAGVNVLLAKETGPQQGEADGGASRLWIGRSSRDLLRLVGHEPGKQHEVFAQGYKQLSGDGQAGVPKRYTRRPCAKGTSTRPWDWETRLRSCKEAPS